MNSSQNNQSNLIDMTTLESSQLTNQHHQRKRPRIEEQASPEIMSWTASQKNFPNNGQVKVAQNEEHCNENNIDGKDDEVIVQSSSVTNPNIDFSHLRIQCGLFSYDSEPNSFCSKCFCSVCDLPVQNCASWSEHALKQTDSVAKNKTKTKKSRSASLNVIQSRAVARTEVNNVINSSVQQHYNQMFQDFWKESLNGNTDNGDRDLWRERKSEKSMKITEILAKKLNLTVVASESNQQNVLNMEGDIPKLSLHDLFYVEGVKIGWPFPRILPPQRLMALHLIRALKRRNHVVMESPTGTGKSAAILCSVLAWQRYHAKKYVYPSSEKSNAVLDEPPYEVNGEVEIIGSKPAVPKIIYCSRTHSQVAQMVASLKKTPYRPRMTVLGSRERLCIHREMTTMGRQDGDIRGSSRININQECQFRVSNTEKMRKSLWHSVEYPYDDDDPPVQNSGDGSGENNFSSVDLTEHTETSIDEDQVEENSMIQGTRKLTCPHYRQLSSARTSVLTRSRFILNKSVISCCKVGGEETSLGVHDIEDLVSFGINPYIHRNIAIYRNGGVGKFGMGIDKDEGAAPIVATLAKDGAAASTGAINENDAFLKINGKKSVDWDIKKTAKEIRETINDPLKIDIIRSGAPYDDESDYHDHSPCPYYLSRAISKHAELIIAPYNYVLDPMIRTALDIELEGNIVILDEAHNVEDTLRDSGSGKYGEIELCELICMLSDYATRQKTSSTTTQNSDVGEIDLSVLAHEILLMLEKVVEFLISSRKRFENGVGMNSANGAIDEHDQYHSPDDKHFEVTFDGPTGYGIGGRAVGCKPFFDKMGFTETQFAKLSEFAKELESRLGGNIESDGNDSFLAMRRNNTLLSLLNAFVTKFLMAIRKPEHYFVQSAVHPNGSFAFASGRDDGSNRSRFRKKPKSFPLIRPRTQHNPNASLFACPHKCCQSNQNLGMAVSHGDFCDGTTPRWESVLILELLTPGILMEDISSQCRTIVLASGSLAPISSLCAELNLYPSTPNVAQHDSKSGSPITPKLLNKPGRLQIVPKPLEANHVINHDKQLRTVSIGNFPDGSALTVSYSHYKHSIFFPKLGNAIASIVEAIPRGGVLIFVPSYSFLRKCVKSWDPSRNENRWSYTQSNDEEDSSIWERFISSKGQVIVEPTGSQEKFEIAKKEYNDAILNEGKCILLAVFRGKMSEGISFNDDFARAVICVGIPFPNVHDKAISAKRNYNDEQRKLCNRTDLLPGNDWYLQQAYRAIAQALGRCIRHDADYGVIILMDSRHCEGEGPVDRLCHKHRNLPKWMREYVYNLCLLDENRHQIKKRIISGGYRGLAKELMNFFIEAQNYTKTVIDERKKMTTKMSKREFDSNTGRWELKTDNKRQISLSPMTQKNGK